MTAPQLCPIPGCSNPRSAAGPCSVHLLLGAEACPHELLNQEGICGKCGEDCRGLGYSTGHGVLPVEPQPTFTSPITDAIVAISAALNHGPFQPLSQECRKSLRQARERLRGAVENVPVVPPRDSNSVTFDEADLEMEMCKWCGGYHRGGCHREPSKNREASGVVPQGAEPPTPRDIADTIIWNVTGGSLNGTVLREKWAGEISRAISDACHAAASQAENAALKARVEHAEFEHKQIAIQLRIEGDATIAAQKNAAELRAERDQAREALRAGIDLIERADVGNSETLRWVKSARIALDNRAAVPPSEDAPPEMSKNKMPNTAWAEEEKNGNA